MYHSQRGVVAKLDEYLRIKETSEYLGVCQNTLRNWEVAGKIPVLRNPANNYRLFKVSDLKKLLAVVEQSRTRSSTGRPPAKAR
jgi:DNA-binding transcriptional MerR regulator